MKTTWILLALALLATPALAQPQALRLKHFNIKKGLAMEGYDPVSYFTGTPLEGDEALRFTHQGITYQFANQKNLAAFRAAPEKYEPAYGGWCAYAMGETGEKVKVDPETFKIVGGRLYLFYNFWGSNTLTDWNKDEGKLKDAADRNWKETAR